MQAVLIRVSDESLVPDIKAHFERAGIFEVEHVGGSMISVGRPDALNETAQRQSVAVHVRIWQAANPDAGVTVLP